MFIIGSAREDFLIGAWEVAPGALRCLWSANPGDAERFPTEQAAAQLIAQMGPPYRCTVCELQDWGQRWGVLWPEDFLRAHGLAP